MSAVVVRGAMGTRETRLKVVLCWHMHQPQYNDSISGAYQLPWTYLHAIKDYVDMAAHIEAVPEARAVVNFAPILIEQIADYARQVDGFLRNSAPIRDPLLMALAHPVLPGDAEERLGLIHACLRASEERLINRFAPYRDLADIARQFGSNAKATMYFSNQFLADLLVWYHIAWLGETVRRSDDRVKRLMEQGHGYSLHDRRLLLEVVGELLGGLIGRYAALGSAQKVELSITPYAHPIVPLLIDFKTTHDAMPDAALPLAPAYPGGTDRARWHIREGIETFRRHFGYAPVGCWPSEGGVSNAALKLFGEHGFAWAASGEGVLHNSLLRQQMLKGGNKTDWLYQTYAIDETGISCFFRDDGLSDLIGFTYATWHADDAVADLVTHLERIAEGRKDHPPRVVSIIMDGENAWEHYPENGYYFLRALYEKLTTHPDIELTTFSQCLEEGASKRIPELVSGSWVYGTFSTWIGDKDKNRGWDMLVEAKRAFDEAVPNLDSTHRDAAERQLAICEGSDWFWWFGDYNPAQTVSEFERLYRRHLTNLYQLIGREPPESLTQVLAHGSGTPRLGGVMRPGQSPS